MRYLATAITYIGALWIVGMAAIFWILGIAGKESAPVSKTFEIGSYVVCTIAVIVLPALAARYSWKRLS